MYIMLKKMKRNYVVLKIYLVYDTWMKYRVLYSYNNMGYELSNDKRKIKVMIIQVQRTKNTITLLWPYLCV